jgi:putative hydrolase of HD superfamily
VDFDYDFNLAYGQRYTAGDPVLAALRARLDQETARRAAETRDAGGAEPGD